MTRYKDVWVWLSDCVVHEMRLVADRVEESRDRESTGKVSRLMSKRLRYQVAMSLDGFIAGPNGEADWIVMDPSIDFGALFKQFDTAVMGRKTYQVMTTQGSGAMPGLEVIVFSRTLAPVKRQSFSIVGDDPRAVVAALKSKPGRDIWLFGGGVLFRTLLDAGLVDTVEVAVIPVLLGSGIPLLPPGGTTTLALADQRILPTSGIVVLSYSVPGGAGAPRIEYVKPGSVPPKKKRATAGRSARSSRRPQSNRKRGANTPKRRAV